MKLCRNFSIAPIGRKIKKFTQFFLKILADVTSNTKKGRGCAPKFAACDQSLFLPTSEANTRANRKK